MPRTLYFKFRGERENGDRLKPETMDSEYSDPLPNPFGFNEALSGEDFTGGPPAKPLVELEMTQLSAELRRKHSWWTKCHDETILSKWREEALAQSKLMKESHIDYVLKELDGYANLRDKVSGAEVSCHDKIWQSDTLIPASLKERLIAGTRPGASLTLSNRL
ncbi:unnamed protein product [Rhizoctonia solani]|uniref:DUF4246 domain-containing protein n=1 Tax=Rhizoctonia solani TaxID=456999 RepID=A0A8H3B7Y2_9AGAM|nr:unnamed protein product [Rhizoctonia solani]